uniref:Retrovirus-related Pol polyprotein from transposon TNT 1-94-like beta-barrel domain-containing protein n=1 Tax=Lactuca sativa TaxID=4236 RepID=A0A9R1WDV9_LACSA|nr:hypothetical protein LSAT_V11C200096470 [Lactuca sativa]
MRGLKCNCSIVEQEELGLHAHICFCLSCSKPITKYPKFQMDGDKPIMEQVHKLHIMVNKLNMLSISILELFQVGAIIIRLSPSWKDFSKRMMQKFEDYSLDDLMKHLCIEEETCIRDKRRKVRSSVHHVSAGSSGHKTKSEGHNKRNLGPNKQSFKKPSHQNPNSKPKRTKPCHSFRTYHPIPPRTIVVYVDGHRAKVQGRGDVRLKFTNGEWVTLRDVLYVPTILKGLVSTDKFDRGGFKMELEKGRIVITKGRNMLGRRAIVQGCTICALVIRFDTFCEDNGIKHERNLPCTTQHNGLVEIKNRNLCEMNNKAYRLLDDESGVAVECKDVEFFEDKLSRDNENSKSTTPKSTSREILLPPPIMEEPRRSTRGRIEKSFGDDFFFYLVEGT